jgi:hypothetical protein
MQIKACPGCGFENSGPSLFFCKKCGSSLERGEPRRNSMERGGPEGVARIATGKEVAPPPGKSAAGTPSVPGQYRDTLPVSVRSYRKVAIGIAALLLILAAVAGVVFFTKSTDAPAGPDNESGSGLLGLIPPGIIPGTIPENATAPAQPAQKKNTGAGLVSNRAVPVVTDTPLKMK